MPPWFDGDYVNESLYTFKRRLTPSASLTLSTSPAGEEDIQRHFSTATPRIRPCKAIFVDSKKSLCYDKIYSNK